MTRIKKQRQIIDRKALLGRLDEIVGWSGYTPKTQSQILGLFKDALKTGRDEIRRRFDGDGATGNEVTQASAFLIDQLVRAIHGFAVQYVYPVANPTTGEQLAIAATGGYGRGEMAPHSDIDLLFLLPYKKTAHAEQVIEFILYMLWDMGLKVGHATRSVDENIRLARRDLTICTSLLETRLLVGNEDLFQEFRRRFAEDVVAKDAIGFVDAKLAERDARHDSMGDTRYVLEPNIKEGKGGLRDLQTLFWIAKYLYQVDDMGELVSQDVLTKGDARRFARAHGFLTTVRCHLHFIADRPEERLSFDLQSLLAGRMHYKDRAGAKGVERFMKHYFLVAKDVGDLTRVLCAVLEDRQKKPRFRLPSLSFARQRAIKGFRVDGGRLTVENDAAFSDDPVKLIRLFHEAQHAGLDIHPAALRLVNQNLKLINRGLRADGEANRLFLEILMSPNDPQTTLLRLNEAGVLGRFIPDFGRVIAQMQYDMYHVYTVDEHTIRAIGILSRIEAGKLREDHPVSSEVIGEVQSRRVLYLALFAHDIAKGRGGDHSELGARVVEKMAKRFGFDEWETETASWLVLRHLLMSATAFKRDLDDPKTIADFADAVQSPERLRLLLVLTVADVRAVGPRVWNAWKAGLLRDLYARTQEHLTGAATADRQANRVDRAKQALAERLKDWTEDEIEAHLARGYPQYWLSFDTETQARHAKLVRKAEAEGLKLHMVSRVLKEHDATELVIYTADHPGLFSRIAGAIALGGASIVDAKVMTLANGMALDTFWVQDSDEKAIAAKDRREKLKTRVADALSGRLNMAEEFSRARRAAQPRRARAFSVPPHVLVDNKASAQNTVIEINGRNRVGFLHDVTAALTELGLQISSAHISTFGVRVVDVFYVKDIFGLKVEKDEKINAICERLLAAIEPEQPAPQGEAAAAE